MVKEMRDEVQKQEVNEGGEMSDSYNITDTLILLAVIETSFSEHNADSLLLFETKGDRKKKNLDLPETSRGRSF